MQHTNLLRLFHPFLLAVCCSGEMWCRWQICAFCRNYILIYEMFFLLLLLFSSFLCLMLLLILPPLFFLIKPNKKYAFLAQKRKANTYSIYIWKVKQSEKTSSKQHGKSNYKTTYINKNFMFTAPVFSSTFTFDFSKIHIHLGKFSFSLSIQFWKHIEAN